MREDAGTDATVQQGSGIVGDPCDMASDCSSPGTPTCFSTLAPLQGIPANQIVNQTAYDAAASLGLTFPTGYCSTVPTCSSDSQCGTSGGCFAPFTAVTDATLRELEVPLGVETGALNFLPSYGVCLRKCSAVSDCEVGQLCEIPLPEFIGLVPGAVNETTYCVPDPACANGGCTAGPCSPNPCQNGGTCTANGNSFTCACAGGFSGTTCETQTVVPTVPIGGRCTQDAQCNVPSSTSGPAQCVSQIHPLASILPPTESLYYVGIDFPFGYCSNTPNCLSNIQCGAGGYCFAPFRNVTEQTLRDLEMTFDPSLGVGTGDLDFITVLGYCMHKCTDTYECLPDQACQIVMNDFISLVPGSQNTQTLCSPHDDCKFCASNAFCDVDPMSPDTATCVCRPGYTGNGLTCTATGNGACADNPCVHGTCTDGANNTYTCACDAGWTGTNCQNAPSCSPNPCQNGGVCSPITTSTFSCACPAGFTGSTCTTAVTCPALLIPSNGSILLTDNYNYNSSATYGCAPGYTLTGGNSTRTCGANGQWSGTAPTCVSSDPCAPNPCQHGGTCVAGSGSYTCTCTGTGYQGTNCETAITCSTLATPTNGNPVTYSAGQSVGSTATYSCSGSNVLNGSATRTCGPDGTWNGSAPTCVAPTDPCVSMPCQNNGVCTSNGGSRTCDCAGTGYSGTSCETIVNCGAPPSTPNGTATAAATTYGSTATYSCAQDYSLVGEATRTCQANGSWSGTTPTCSFDPCQSNPCVHGTCSINGNTYACDCTGTGYTGTTCNTLITCSTLTMPANGNAVTYSAGQNVGSTATYSCVGGYTLSGNSTRTCQANGQWDGSDPTCAQTVDPCNPNPCNGGTCTPGSGSSYTCSACPNGSSGMNCQIPYDCGALTPPTNGTVSAATTTYGSTATYACNSGYTLSGNGGSATRTCGSTGWSGSAPTCASAVCGTYTDVVYRITGQFDISGTTLGAGDQSFTGLGANATTPSWGTNSGNANNKTVFGRPPQVGSTTFTNGYVRLRYPNNASGTPLQTNVRLVEMYFPLEFTQTKGATVYANVDHSLGIMDNTLANCGGGDSACSTARSPGLTRTCQPNASGTFSSTTLNWGTCTPAPSGSKSWNFVSARAVTGAGCASGWNAWGNNNSTSSLVPASGKGDSYQTWNQQLQPFVFNGSNPLTATFTMAYMQIPNGTNASITRMRITASTVYATQCGSTVGVDLVCNIQ